MEVLDPSVSRDDQPLCVNDSLERGNPPFVVPTASSVISLRRCPRSRNCHYHCSPPRARDTRYRIVWIQRDDNGSNAGCADARMSRKWKRSVIRNTDFTALSLSFHFLSSRQRVIFTLCQLCSIFFFLPYRFEGAGEQ